MLLDRLDIEVDQYSPIPEILKADHEQAIVEERFVSHLLKSNCLVTGQPDWASVQIHYVGAPIDQEAMLRYLIGFRNHNEFHEQCVERIFMDVLKQCKPQKLGLCTLYASRGSTSTLGAVTFRQQKCHPINEMRVNRSFDSRFNLSCRAEFPVMHFRQLAG